MSAGVSLLNLPREFQEVLVEDADVAINKQLRYLVSVPR